MVALPAPERIEEGEAPPAWPPAQVRAIVERAERLLASGLLEEALAEELKAIDLAPYDAYLRNNVGATLARLDRKEEALEHFKCAVELSPGHPGMRRNLAYALWQLDQRREAMAALTGLDHPLTMEAAKALSDLHLRDLVRRGAISWAGGKPRGSRADVELSPGPKMSEWIINSRR